MRFTYTNSLMDESLRELENYPLNKAHTFHGDILRFASLLHAEIVYHNECYLLRRLGSAWQAISDGEFSPDDIIPDRSGVEDAFNHLHISEFTLTREPSIAFLGIGVAVAEIISLKLRETFPGIPFHISVSFPVKPMDADNISTKNDCRVSFHALREGETIYGNLEKFLYEAVGIVEL